MKKSANKIVGGCVISLLVLIFVTLWCSMPDAMARPMGYPVSGYFL